MKSLITVLSTLGLSFALTMSAAAQEATRRDAAIEPAAEPAQPALDNARPQGRRTQVEPGEELRDGPRLDKTAAATPSQATHLPLAEAKKQYLAAKERLQNLVKGETPQSLGVLVRQLNNDLELSSPEPRARIHLAVADDFDARRELQQAELAELEARVARIKRTMQIRDAMRDTLIDQRTDELLEQMEDGGKSGKRDGPIPEDPDATNGAATAPARRRTLEIMDAEIGFNEAEANLRAAKRLYDYAKKMSAKGYVTNDEVQEKAASYEAANLKLDRAREKLKSLGGTPQDGDHGADKTSAESGANLADSESRPLELDAYDAIANFESAERAYRRLEKRRASGAIEQAVLDEQVEKLSVARNQLERAAENAAFDIKEAQANLESAKRAYMRAEKLHASGAIEQAVLDEQADKYNRAQIELDRLESKINAFDRVEEKLKGLDQPPAGDGAVIDPMRNNSFLSAFDHSLIDPDQIAWGPKDSDLLPAREGEPTGALQLGLDMDPKKAVYTPGDVLTARLFLKYTGKQRSSIVVPRSFEERLGIELCDTAGEKLDWHWGPARKKPERSPNVSIAFKPGAMQQFPNLKIVVARDEMRDSANDDPTVFAYLHVKPGQTARLLFNLSSDLLQLQSAPFELRVEEPAD